ncbi:MAG TPA: hypothetical protein PLA71_00465 [Saccharofermentans sp.]|nr:hypothetical protein [Saccharofermentans sp.]
MSKISRRFVELTWANTNDVLRAQDIPVTSLASIKDYLDQHGLDISTLSGDVASLQLQDGVLEGYFADFLPLSGTTELTGNIIPAVTNTLDLGSISRTFRDIYVSGYSLKTKITSIESSVSANASDISDLESDMSIAQADISDIDGRLGIVSGNLDALEIMVAGIGGSISSYIPLSGTDTIYGELTPNVTDTHTLGTNSRRWGDLYISNFGSVSGKLNTLDSDITSLAGSISMNSINIGVLSAQVGYLSADTATYGQDIINLSGFIDTLDLKVDTVSGDLTTYIDSVSAIADMNFALIQLLETSAQTLSADLDSKFDSLSAAIDLIDVSGISQIALEVDLLSADVEILKADVSGHGNSIFDLESQMASLSSQVGDYDADDFVKADGSNLVSGNLRPFDVTGNTLGDSTNTWADLFLTGYGSVTGTINTLSSDFYNRDYENIFNNGASISPASGMDFSTDFALTPGDKIGFSLGNIKYLRNNVLETEVSAIDNPYQPIDELDFARLETGMYQLSADVLSGGWLAKFNVLNFLYRETDLDNLSADHIIQLAMTGHPELSGKIFFRQAITVTDNDPDLPSADFSLWTPLNGLSNVEEVVSLSGDPRVLTSIDSGSIFTNEGASSVVWFELPSAVPGLNFKFICQDANGLQINATNGNTIRIAGTESAADGNVESTTVGSILSIYAINTSEWYGTSDAGTWNVT